MLPEALRLAAAVLISFAGMAALRAPRRTVGAWIARLVISTPLFIAALWIVVTSIPYPRDPGAPTFSIVGSAVLIAGLAVEELLGADLRRILRI